MLQGAGRWCQSVAIAIWWVPKHERDDECVGGPNAICLNAKCFIKGAPLGGGCEIDSTDYYSYDAEGDVVEQNIVRDNCTVGTYCGAQQTCIVSKPNGQYCQQDRECLSQTCSNGDVCIQGPDVFHTIPVWLWAVVGVSVFVFVFVILLGLWVLHRYQSKKEHAKIVKFFGDNEEFAKYAMADPIDRFYGLSNPTSTTVHGTESLNSVVYLTTPDYKESSALAATQPLGRRNISQSKLRAPSPSEHSVNT
ncbi:hypothetical protein DFQ28_007453 [Apophysomyces sp. BC1034]|nr:hypothetical protein DFQ28_007453 [Apophysomyces sp. BC1034]